jgi:hypothetical protein
MTTEPSGKSGELKRYALVNDGRLAWKIPDEDGFFVPFKDAEAALNAQALLMAAKDVEILKMRRALDAVVVAAFGFADAHSLPCLEDAVIIALKAVKELSDE